MDIGATIKKLRQKSGITQHYLAEQLNVSMQTVSRWETNATYPDIAILPILAKYFNVTVDYLLNVKGDTAMETIKSKRFSVREWRDSDAADLFAIKQSSNSFIYYKHLSSVSDCLDCIKIWREYGEMYPVILNETGKLIGVVGLVDVGRYDGYRELEVHVCDKFNTVDCVTEIHKLILDYGFNTLGLSVVFALCECDNELLKESMVNAGFFAEGTLRKFGRDKKDRIRYSILKEKYLQE